MTGPELREAERLAAELREMRQAADATAEDEFAKDTEGQR